MKRVTEAEIKEEISQHQIGDKTFRILPCPVLVREQLRGYSGQHWLCFN